TVHIVFGVKQDEMRLAKDEGEVSGLTNATVSMERVEVGPFNFEEYRKVYAPNVFARATKTATPVDSTVFEAGETPAEAV
ncbi:MAG TPA: hypothetical protein VHN77_08230, partial [Phycisphaerales bacterium]|nr:hypothetical protein [Phycisphaerales bacterium]